MNETKIPKIRVLIRKRPMNKRQIARNQTDIINVENNQTVIVREQKLKVDLTPYIDEYKFNFDGAYDQFATNQQIYATSIRPLVDSAFDGAKVSCFAYGQTGSGKTHTMLGNGSDVQGLYLLAAIDIFNEINNQHEDVEAWVSFYEIYCGKLYDLLNQKNILYARQDAKNNVNIVGLSQTKIQNYENLMQIIQYGTGIRVTSQNGTNNDSSRSHAILQITLKKKNKPHGKISFIDLAGSERAADHADQLQKQTRIDGAQINKSLLALKECIRALDQNKHHTPFRGSKLTMVLKDSFTGYCRTVMIGNISPNSSSSQNTLNTLKYADRVKQLKKPNKQSFLQMQKIDQLQKQLMLPRTIHRKPSKTSNLQQDSYKQFRQNINTNVEPNFNKMKVMHNEQPKRKISPNNFINQNHSNAYRPTSVIEDKRNSPMPQNTHNSSSNYQNYRKNAQRHSPQPILKANLNNLNQNDFRRSPPSKNSLFVQQNQSVLPMSERDLMRLSERHDEYVQLILEQEQALLKHHEHHINSIIELTKKQMGIKTQADKIGSRIQDYLENLSQVLDSKLESIFTLKERIQKIKQHLEESKNLQEQYLVCSRSLNLSQQHEEDNMLLLDDDEGNEQLFRN